MPYIGRSLGDGVRARYIYAATSGQTTFSGNDANGIALAYSDTLYMDVYQNGVLLKPVTDYASTTGTSVVLVTGASTNDVVEMIVYDSFAVADTVSAANGGTFSGTVSMSDDLTVATNKLFVDASTDLIGMGTTSPATATGGGIDIHRGGGSSVRIDDTTNSVTGELQVYSAGLNLATVTDHPLLLSTNNTTAMNITGDGEITKPLQPTFSVSPASAINNLAINSYITIAFGTEHYDVGSNFASNTFTAPVTGKYQLSFQLYTLYIDEDAAYTYWSILTSNREYFIIFDSGAFDQEAETWTPTLSITADMDANDTAYMRFYQSGGTAQVTVSTASYFTGALIC
jgi:hypothetical protein